MKNLLNKIKKTVTGPTTDEQIEHMVRSLVKGGFCKGWFGNTSEEFIQEQVKYAQQKPVYFLTHHYSNLLHYCGVKEKDIIRVARKVGAAVLRLPEGSYYGYKRLYITDESDFQYQTTKGAFSDMTLKRL